MRQYQPYFDILKTLRNMNLDVIIWNHITAQNESNVDIQTIVQIVNSNVDIRNHIVQQYKLDDKAGA